MDQNIINFDEMNHEYLEKQKMEHRFGSYWLLTCGTWQCNLVSQTKSRVAGLLGTTQRIELERRKQEIEREKDELKQFYSEAFECSTHSVNHDPNFLQLLDDVVVSIILRKNEIGGF